MAEEVKKEGEVEVVEGTVEAEIIKEETPEVKPEAIPETVPLAVYLDLKKDMKALEKEIGKSKNSDKSTVAIEGLEELKKKYDDVNPDFIADLLESATKQATKNLEDKFTPAIKKIEDDKKQEAFDKAFDSLFDKTIKDNPDLPKNIDKEAIKELAITPKYRNVPLADILNKMYGSNEGRDSSENEIRNGSDVVDNVVDFSKITDDQKNAIMDDPKSRKKYFDWLDTQTGR